MSLKFFSGMTLTLAATFILAGCSLSRQPARQGNTGNLVSIFVVVKDNMTTAYRGEIYPLALRINDRYVNVSQDITQAVRTQSPTARILQLESPRSFLTAIKNFTVTQQNQPQGRFTVDWLAATSYVCIDSRSIANLVGTIDLNGNGTDEAILQNNDYESTSFSIYEYKSDRLTEVFNGGGFGC